MLHVDQEESCDFSNYHVHNENVWGENERERSAVMKIFNYQDYNTL